VAWLSSAGGAGEGNLGVHLQERLSGLETVLSDSGFCQDQIRCEFAPESLQGSYFGEGECAQGLVLGVPLKDQS